MKNILIRTRILFAIASIILLYLTFFIPTFFYALGIPTWVVQFTWVGTMVVTCFITFAGFAYTLLVAVYGKIPTENKEDKQ